jgi:glucokinase
MILAGDIGGTNTRLAFFNNEDGRLKHVTEEVFPSRNYPGLDEIAAGFVQSKGLPVTQAAFGIAGPVQNNRCQATNLPWVVDGAQLAARLGLGHVILMNDLEANAYGIPALEPTSFAVIQEGRPGAVGNGAVISAGTGLGEAGLYWDGRQHRPFATEGGHASFSPCTELEDELLRYLRRQFPHVSWERVVSGPGLLNIYRFLRDTGHGEEPAWLADEMKQKDSSAVISRAALEGRSDLCVQALDMFVSLYGSEAGNLAVKLIATGGVYLGGGIAPKILAKIKTSTFLDAFLDKGRMRELLETIPIRVILDDKTALKGAARRSVLQETASAAS